MKKIVFLLVVLLVSFSLAADWYVKSVTHTDEMEIMGQKQPAKDEYNELWISIDKMTNKMSSGQVIIDLGKKKMFFVDHNEKSYFETDLPLDMNKILPPEAKQMMAAMKMTVKVTPTNETKVINNWKSKAYDVDMNMMMVQIKMKVWATKDLPIDYNRYFAMYTEMMKLSQGVLDEAAVAEFKKIDGYQVLSEGTVSIMGTNIKTYTKVLEAKQSNPPAGIYSVPEGYTKKANLDLQKLRQ